MRRASTLFESATLFLLDFVIKDQGTKVHIILSKQGNALQASFELFQIGIAHERLIYLFGDMTSLVDTPYD